MRKLTLAFLLPILFSLLMLVASPVGAVQNPLTVDRIFDSEEFHSDSYSVNWMPEGGTSGLPHAAEQLPTLRDDVARALADKRVR